MRSNRIRMLLNFKGIKTKELAKKIGITSSTLNRKLKGDVKFLDKDIEIILDELNMSYEKVFKSENLSTIYIENEIYFVPEKTATEVKKILKKECIK